MVTAKILNGKNARLKAEQGVQNMDSSSMADDLEI
jgi:hypothetical protein